MQRLTNERWGFSSNCFVCEPTNTVGLRQAFFHDPAADLVVADLEMGPEHSGAPAYVHGGVQLALLDEGMAWAAIAVAGCFAVTATFSAEFHHPIRVGKRYRLEARITERRDSSVDATSRIVDDQGRPRTSASATLVILSAAQAVDAGAPTDDSTSAFVRP